MSVTEGGSLESFPVLWQFLTDDRWEDGGVRQLPTLLVFVGENGLTVALNDRDQGQTVFKSGSGLEGLLAALEDGLGKGSLEWRPSGGGGKGRKSRKTP